MHRDVTNLKRKINKQKVYAWMAEHGIPPKTRQVMEITGLKNWGARMLMEEIRDELPEINNEDIQKLLRERIKRSLEDPNAKWPAHALVRSMEFLMPKKIESKSEEIHKIVLQETEKDVSGLLKDYAKLIEEEPSEIRDTGEDDSS